MKQYRFELMKYSPTQKHICPNCGQRTFVPYIDTLTGEVMAGYGRCDRQAKCGYFTHPKQDGGIHIFEKDIETMMSKQPLQPTNEHYYIDKEYLLKSIRPRYSHFEKFLYQKFSNEKINGMYRALPIGATKKQSTIFWYVDFDGHIRNGKIMDYGETTGKRVHHSDGTPDVSWAHTQLKKVGALAEGWQYQRCLFGERQLFHRPEDIVCLVESEKTAIIATLFLPDYVWIATGGESNFRGNNVELFQHLRGRQVIVYPDCDFYDKWSMEAKKLAAAIGSRIIVSDIVLKSKLPTDDAGFDLADLMLREIEQAEDMPSSAILENPEVIALIADLGLIEKKECALQYA